MCVCVCVCVCGGGGGGGGGATWHYMVGHRELIGGGGGTTWHYMVGHRELINLLRPINWYMCQLHRSTSILIEVMAWLIWSSLIQLTHWGRVTHICVSEITIIGSDNGLSPGRRQAIIWTNAGIFFIGPLGTNFSEISIEIQTFSLKKMHLKMSSANVVHFVSASMC